MSALGLRDFAIKSCAAVLEMSSKLPEEQKELSMKLAFELAENPNKSPHRVRELIPQSEIFVYTHPSPALEMTFKLDGEGKTIHFVHFVAPALTMMKPVFVSYAHEDDHWLQLVLKSLEPLEAKDLINIWDDRKIQAGKKWKMEIENALKAAKAAVLLVSHNFLASEFISKEELPFILAAAEKDELDLLWIAIAKCAYEETELKHYEAVNDIQRPLTDLPAAELDAALKRIFRRIEEVISPN